MNSVVDTQAPQFSIRAWAQLLIALSLPFQGTGQLEPLRQSLLLSLLLNLPPDITAELHTNLLLLRPPLILLDLRLVELKFIEDFEQSPRRERHPVGRASGGWSRHQWAPPDLRCWNLSTQHSLNQCKVCLFRK